MLHIPDSPLIQRIRQNRCRLILGPLVLILGVLILLTGFHVHKLYGTVTERFEGKRWSLPSKIYSDAFAVYPGQEVSGIRLFQRLERLGYHPVSFEPDRAGGYSHTSDRIDLYLHRFSYPDHEVNEYPIRLELRNGIITRIIDRVSDEEIAYFELEPELIAGFFDETWEERNLIRLDEVAPSLIAAILAVEDTRFYQHLGIDPRGIARAMWVNLKNFAIVQGGSTLTQQLVKNFYLGRERTFSRKINEAVMALLLEARYSKDEILEAYLNEIYLGQSGSMGIYGVGEASRFYFGKTPRELTLAESALMAGIINSPNIFSPFHDPQKAANRQRVVLDRMHGIGFITEDEYREASDEPFLSAPPVQQGRKAPYFVDYVRQQLSEDYPAEVLMSDGLRIFTTLDMEQQALAEASVSDGLERLESRFPSLRAEESGERLQGALIAVQPQTGHIKAMVGGRDYGLSQFNRVTQARRQPGSLFKIFVYSAAITQDGNQEMNPYTAATLLDDSPLTMELPDGPWSPENYDKKFQGDVTLSTAFENSLNVPTVKLAEEVGMERVIDTARRLGIESPLRAVPSLALGTSETTPLEMAVGYGTIANNGVKAEPLAIKAVVTVSGKVVQRKMMEMTQAMTPQQAYVMTHLLEGVAQRGTAKGIRNLGIAHAVAGKTGTSSHHRDAWFSGFTPDLLALVWVGFDQYTTGIVEYGSGRDSSWKKVPLTGATAALPIWADFMKRATAGQPSSQFMVPPGIVFKKIDPKTGLLAGFQCPEGVREAFIKGSEPTKSCQQSIGMAQGVIDWFKGLFSTHYR